MPLAPRTFSFLVLAGLALAATGCGKSNNVGKIEGRWKIVSAPGLDEMTKQLDEVKAYLFMEFRPDGSMSMGADFDDPKMKELAEKEAANSGEKLAYSWKYKLLSGDAVEFYDLPKELQDKGGMFGKNKDRARTNVRIEGDTLTMTDDDGKSGKFVKLK